MLTWCFFVLFIFGENRQPSVALAQVPSRFKPLWQVGLGFQSPRFSGSLVFSLPPRRSGSLRLTAPGCTLIPLGS